MTNPLDLLSGGASLAGGLTDSTSQSAGSSNNAGAYQPVSNSPFNVGSGSASGSAAGGSGSGLPSWLPWAAAGLALSIAALVLLRRH